MSKERGKMTSTYGNRSPKEIELPSKNGKPGEVAEKAVDRMVFREAKKECLWKSCGKQCFGQLSSFFSARITF